MAQRFQFKIAGIDVSDYVLYSDEVAVSERNRDGSLVASEFQFKLSYFVQTALGRAPQADDEVLVSSSNNFNYPFFVGYIRDTLYDQRELTWRLTAAHKLAKLQALPLRYSELHSALTGGTSDLDEYCADDNESAPNVQMIYLLSRLCHTAGISLDTSALEGTFTRLKLERLWVSEAYAYYDFYLEDVVLDENMLYALGQPWAASRTYIEADAERLARVLTLFDLLSLLASTFDLVFYWRLTGATETLKVVRASDTLFNVDNDLDLDPVEELIERSPGGYKWVQQFHRDRSTYQAAAETAFEASAQSTSYEAKADVSPPTNFAPFYRSKETGAALGDVFSMYSVYVSAAVLADRRRAAVQRDHTKKETEVPWDLSGTYIYAHRHAVDVESLTSTVRQEVPA